MAVITYISSIIPVNPWFYLLSSIPILLTGGSSALITGVFCYLTDVTSKNDRALK